MDDIKKYVLLEGDDKKILQTIPDHIFHTAITSPPYWSLRDYFAKDQLGNEPTPEEYIENMVSICKEVKRVLRKDGTFWLNIGDSYNNESGFCRATKGWGRDGRDNGSADKKAIKHPYIKRKDLVGIPWMLAFALRKDGWYLRCDIVWEKTNPMPDGAKDRPTRGHEYLFLLTPSPKYFYDYYNSLEATAYTPQQMQRFGARNQKGTFRQDQNRTFEHYGMRNRRAVWKTAVSNFKGEHFATYPIDLIEPCIKTSTSDYGCCSQCGKQWVRETKKVDVPSKNSKGYERKLIALDWHKDCSCPTNEVQPSLVFDPFSGMATTGIASLRHGRYYVGTEINSDYIRMSIDRIETEMGHDQFMRGKNDIREVLYGSH